MAGLEEAELKKLAQLGKKAIKTSRRDIAHVVSFCILLDVFLLENDSFSAFALFCCLVLVFQILL